MVLYTLAEYPVTQILPLIPKRRTKFIVENQEFWVKTCSLRLQVFKRSLTCIQCGLVGSIFRLEKQPNRKERPHLNLYSIKEGNRLILMTQDHIIPRSKGGADKLDNLSTMCVECNVKKGNLYEPL